MLAVYRAGILLSFWGQRKPLNLVFRGLLTVQQLELLTIMKSIKHLLLTSGLLAASAIYSSDAEATIVQFETSLGNFEVNLYDQGTPVTVENFLNYVNAGSYENIIIHRSVPDFIVQGGGFAYQNSWPVNGINTNAAIVNEPEFSNVRGTIAMAKIGGNPNSATSQWFFNLADNSTTGGALDIQNSGFTVFGEVVGDGMAIVDQIAGLPRYNFSSSNGALGELPLQNYTAGNTPDDTNLIIINRITIIDATVDSAASLNPPRNTSQNTTTPPPPPTSSSSGGGSFGVMLLGLLGLLGMRKRA